MIDTNVNGLIEFSELKASMLKTTIFLQQDNLRKTFSFFDKDKSGYITIDELKCVFETHEDIFNIFE
jgi:Ca2+-binding EF-hand superfamily protein